MRKSAFISSALFLLNLAFFVAPVMPQDAKAQGPTIPEARTQPVDVHYYRLEFVLKELGDDGRVVNSRTYHTRVSTDGKNSSLRIGTKIPVRTNEKGEINYTDVGVNIDSALLRETAQGLALQISGDVRSLANPSSAGETSAPIIRQNFWSLITAVPIGKPTVVFSSDNLENKGRMQVEVTATPIH